VPLAVGLCVIAILSAFYFFYYYEPNRILMNWQVKIHFFDYRYGTNYTLPALIGVEGGIWTNHTLDQYGQPGYSPLSTRDGTGNIYIVSKVFELYTFEDFFNIWGQPFNQFCVPLPPQYSPTNPYCTGPGDPILYDPDNSAVVDSQSQVIYNSPGAPPPAQGTRLSTDPRIKYIDSNNNDIWDPGEPVVYDIRNTGSLVSTDWIVNSTGSQSPTQGTPLKFDSTLKFVDSRGIGVWEQPRTPPGMSDGRRDSCINNGYALSNNEDWIIFLYSGFAASISGNCLS